MSDAKLTTQQVRCIAAAKMRAEGHTLPQIAEHFGWTRNGANSRVRIGQALLNAKP